jgi:hypothetical protein
MLKYNITDHTVFFTLHTLPKQSTRGTEKKLVLLERTAQKVSWWIIVWLIVMLLNEHSWRRKMV